jgi:dTDP-4-dehydrorhamnose reductase
MQTGRVSGFTNAIFSGLTTNAVADEIGRLIRVSPGLSGVFHLAGERISKFHLLEQVRTAFGLHCELVADPTVRIDRSLIGERYAAATGFCPPAWPEMIADLVRERPSYERPSSRQRRISTGS